MGRFRGCIMKKSQKPLAKTPANLNKNPSFGRVNTTLQGPIADIFMQILPNFGQGSREQAYDRIMDNPPILHGCFQIFRAKPDLFAPFLIDGQGRKVEDPAQTLSCGQALNQVITLVVRAAARRYFRATLNPKKPRQAPLPPSLGQLVKSMLGFPPPPKPPVPVPPGERLYRALRSFLLYEWQVPLIPHYAPIPVAMIDRLGPRILEYRHVEELQALAAGHVPAAGAELAPLPSAAGKPSLRVATSERPTPASVSGNIPARTIMEKDGSTLDGEALWRLFEKHKLREVFPGRTERDLRHGIMHICAMNTAAVTSLLYIVGLDARQFMITMLVAEQIMGPEDFLGAFGTPGRARMLDALSLRLVARKLSTLTTPAGIQATAQAALEDIVQRRSAA